MKVLFPIPWFFAVFLLPMRLVQGIPWCLPLWNIAFSCPVLQYTTYKWCHVICFSPFDMPSTSSMILVFLRAAWYSILYICSIFMIYFSGFGHLGWLHIRLQWIMVHISLFELTFFSILGLNTSKWNFCIIKQLNSTSTENYPNFSIGFKMDNFKTRNGWDFHFQHNPFNTDNS